MTAPHRDVNDPPDGWVAMIAIGEFTGGHLYLPDINVALPHRNGDVIFFRSWVLKHFIQRYEGEYRYVIVFSTSHKNLQWLEDLVFFTISCRISFW